MNTLKKRFSRFIIFILLLFLVDHIIGSVLKKFYETSNHLEIAKIRYTMDSTYQDILIFGSSRAEHHYDPKIISEYTGLSAYNCGIGGQGIVFSYIQIHETLNRYKPKLIILDISPNILLDPLSQQKLSILRPYYLKDTLIEKILTNGILIEKLKFISYIYPYNGTIFNTLSSLIYYHPDSTHGYLAIKGRIDTTALKTINLTCCHAGALLNNQKIYLKKIISECKKSDVPVLLIVSPIYNTSIAEKNIIADLNTFSKSFSIIFVDYSGNFDSSKRIEFFKDNLHLNKSGSLIFSLKISERINTIERISCEKLLPKKLENKK